MNRSKGGAQASPFLFARRPNTYYYTYMRKLTITVSDAVYEGLHRRIGARRISSFIDRLARPYVDNDAAEALYRAAQGDQDRLETLSDWDELPADEALPADEPS
jgi:predicted CopG family antitoxin